MFRLASERKYTQWCTLAEVYGNTASKKHPHDESIVSKSLISVVLQQWFYEMKLDESAAVYVFSGVEVQAY